MVTSRLSYFSKLTLKNAHFCIILPYFYKHELNELGYTSGSWDIDCERNNLSKVTSKTAISPIG